MISIIVAVSDDWGIGRGNELLWHIPGDLKRFKRITVGKTVVMGKRTWESLPVHPLPGRKNIVLTDVAGEQIEGALAVYSTDEALAACSADGEVFVIGGGSVYRQFMPVAGRLYITHVHSTAAADVFFPPIDMDVWRVAGEEALPEGETGGVPYRYVIYERR